MGNNLSKILKKKIVFITGTGHCGSTLLDLLLSSHSEIFGVGELASLYKNEAYFRGEMPLSNVNGFNDKYWTKENIQQLSKFSESSGFLRNFLIKSKLLTHPKVALYKFLFFLTKKNVIVDSSKNIKWIEESITALKNSREFELYLIYITRDGRAVINSYYRKYPERTIEGITRKWIERVTKINKSYKKIGVQKKQLRYEDLSQGPAAVIKEICRFIGIEYEESMVQYWRHEHHHIGGNAGTKSLILKYKEKDLRLGGGERDHYEKHGLEIKLDERWKKELTNQQLDYINNKIDTINKPLIISK